VTIGYNSPTDQVSEIVRKVENTQETPEARRVDPDLLRTFVKRTAGVVRSLQQYTDFDRREETALFVRTVAEGHPETSEFQTAQTG